MSAVYHDEHIPEDAFCIHMIKDCMCGAYITLPFRSMPQQLIIYLFYWDIFWINIFPSDANIFKFISPWAIITGLELNFQNNLKV